jgi:hypothetical protein
MSHRKNRRILVSADTQTIAVVAGEGAVSHRDAIAIVVYTSAGIV